jgi:hypothetical protein
MPQQVVEIRLMGVKLPPSHKQQREALLPGCAEMRAPFMRRIRNLDC